MALGIRPEGRFMKRAIIRLSSGGVKLIALLLAGQAAVAAPSVNAINGTIAENEELIVTGSGFGQKQQAAPIFFDTQKRVWVNGNESQPYAGVSDGSSVPVGASWPWTRSKQGDLRISKGGYPHYFGTFDSDFPADLWLEDPAGFPAPSSGDVQQLYVRWWFKMSASPESSDEGAQSNKFIRVRDTASSDFNIGLAWTQMHATSGAGFGTSWGNTRPTPGEWNLMELVWQFEPTPLFKATLNGQVRHSVQDWSPPQGHGGIKPRLWGMDGSGVADFSGESLQLSDYYADSTLARVEIGDAPVWSDVSVREPQILKEWSASRIRVELYEGLLGDLNGKYLYVVDSNGQVNSAGFPLGSASAGPPPTGSPRPNPPVALVAE